MRLAVEYDFCVRIHLLAHCMIVLMRCCANCGTIKRSCSQHANQEGTSKLARGRGCLRLQGTWLKQTSTRFNYRTLTNKQSKSLRDDLIRVDGSIQPQWQLFDFKGMSQFAEYESLRGSRSTSVLTAYYSLPQRYEEKVFNHNGHLDFCFGGSKRAHGSHFDLQRTQSLCYSGFQISPTRRNSCFSNTALRWRTS
jgi:hypothetical protein